MTTEIEQTRATLARVRAKLRAARPDSREYYESCLTGWLRWLEKLQKEANYEVELKPK